MSVCRCINFSMNLQSSNPPRISASRASRNITSHSHLHLVHKPNGVVLVADSHAQSGLPQVESTDVQDTLPCLEVAHIVSPTNQDSGASDRLNSVFATVVSRSYGRTENEYDMSSEIAAGRRERPPEPGPPPQSVASANPLPPLNGGLAGQHCLPHHSHANTTPPILSSDWSTAAGTTLRWHVARDARAGTSCSVYERCVPAGNTTASCHAGAAIRNIRVRPDLTHHRSSKARESHRWLDGWDGMVYEAASAATASIFSILHSHTPTASPSSASPCFVCSSEVATRYDSWIYNRFYFISLALPCPQQQLPATSSSDITTPQQI